MLILAGALLGLRLLTGDLSAALDAAAFSVGSAMVSVLDRQIERDNDVATSGSVRGTDMMPCSTHAGSTPGYALRRFG